LTRDLRSSLTISLREEAEAFVSRLSRKFVMIKSVNKWTIAKCKKFENERNYEEKWKFYDFINKSTCLRKAQLFNKWLSIAFDEQ
jgi:hypothetical protein